MIRQGVLASKLGASWLYAVLLLPMVLTLSMMLLGAASAGADLNGDGFADAVFAIGGDSNRVCFGDGAGGFSHCTDVSPDKFATHGVALGDVDGDADFDIVFTNQGSTPNRLCKNDGAGSFACTDVSADTHASVSVALGDVDGDGDLDAVFANSGFGINRLCKNDGSGGFTCADVSADAYTTSSVALGDVDGDGDLDAVFSNYSTDPSQPNQVCENDGAGGFICTPITCHIPGKARDVALGDVDGDGDLDAVFAYLGNANRACMNDGAGAFSSPGRNVDSTRDTDALALGDVDGDGDLDAVFADRGPNKPRRVCKNDGAGFFTCVDADPGGVTHWAFGVALGDLDGDLAMDAVFTRRTQPCRVCKNDGTGGFGCTDVGPEKYDGRKVALSPSAAVRRVDLAVSVEGPANVTAGSGGSEGNATYAVTVTNNGPGDATGVELSETLTFAQGITVLSTTPSGLTVFDVVPPQDASQAATQTAGTWTVGKLARGSSAMLVFELSVPGTVFAATDAIHSHTEVSAVHEADRDAANDQATIATAVQPNDSAVDLVVAVVGSIVATAGTAPEELIHGVKVTNNGPGIATGVVLDETLTLPSGVSVASITPSGATAYAPVTPAAGTWTVGDLAVGATASLDVALTVGGSAAPGTDVIRSQVQVSAVNEVDTDPDNDQASLATSVDPASANLAVSLYGPPWARGQTNVQGNLGHTVMVVNNGPSIATGVQLQETLVLPPAVSVVSATPSVSTALSPSSGAWIEGQNNRTWTVGELGVGQSATLDLLLAAADTVLEGQSVYHEVTVSGAYQPDPLPGDNSMSFRTELRKPEADLGLSLQGPAPVTAGSGQRNAMYTVGLTNVGPNRARDVEVKVLVYGATIVLPAGVTFTNCTASLNTSCGYTPRTETTPLSYWWQVHTLDSGAQASLFFYLTIDGTAAPGQDVIGVDAQIVQSTVFEYHRENNRDVLNTSVLNPAPEPPPPAPRAMDPLPATSDEVPTTIPTTAASFPFPGNFLMPDDAFDGGLPRENLHESSNNPGDGRWMSIAEYRGKLYAAYRDYVAVVGSNGEVYPDFKYGVGMPAEAHWLAGSDTIHLQSFDGSRWRTEPFTDSGSSHGPSLAEFDGKLYAAWRGVDSDSGIYFSSFDGTGWASQKKIPGVGTKLLPALAAHNGKLYAAWKGATDDSIYYASFDGMNWSAQSTIPGTATSVAPSLASYGGALWAAWKGRGGLHNLPGHRGDQSIYYSVYDGSWFPQRKIEGVASAFGPSLVVYRGVLYAFWMGRDAGRWWEDTLATGADQVAKIASLRFSAGASLVTVFLKEIKGILKLAGNHINKAILGNYGGDDRHGLLTGISVAQDTHVYYSWLNGTPEVPNWEPQRRLAGAETRTFVSAAPYQDHLYLMASSGFITDEEKGNLGRVSNFAEHIFKGSEGVWYSNWDLCMGGGTSLYSRSKGYRLSAQDDGNVVIYRTSDNQPLWQSNTQGETKLCFDRQGDLRIHWGSVSRSLIDETVQPKGSVLILQDDGNLVLYDIDRNPLWASMSDDANRIR